MHIVAKSMRLMLIFGLIIGAFCFNSNAYNRTSKGHKVTDVVWFDMTIGGEFTGRIEIGLFGRLAPLTVRNFIEMATNPVGKGYKGSKIYAVHKGIRLIGGDFTRNDGFGAQAHNDGPCFMEEGLRIKHYGAGWVGMRHDEPLPNISLFFISTGRMPRVNFGYVVFGKVVKGMNVVRKIDKVEVNDKQCPIIDVIIKNCGAEEMDPPFYVAKAPATD